MKKLSLVLCFTRQPFFHINPDLKVFTFLTRPRSQLFPELRKARTTNDNDEERAGVGSGRRSKRGKRKGKARGPPLEPERRFFFSFAGGSNTHSHFPSHLADLTNQPWAPLSGLS